MARLSRWLVSATLCAAAIAGCGGAGNSSTSSSQGGSTARTTSAPATTTATAKPSPGPSSVPTRPAAVAEAVAVCKQVVARAPTLSASTKAKVEGVCNKAAHGDLAGARAAAKEVCTEVIDASPIPGPAKAQALAACKRAS